MTGLGAQVKLPRQQRQFLTVMPNLFREAGPVRIFERYDLKGSLLARYVDVADEEGLEEEGKGGVMEGQAQAAAAAAGSSNRRTLGGRPGPSTTPPPGAAGANICRGPRPTPTPFADDDASDDSDDDHAWR